MSNAVNDPKKVGGLREGLGSESAWGGGYYKDGVYYTPKDPQNQPNVYQSTTDPNIKETTENRQPIQKDGQVIGYVYTDPQGNKYSVGVGQTEAFEKNTASKWNQPKQIAPNYNPYTGVYTDTYGRGYSVPPENVNKFAQQKGEYLPQRYRKESKINIFSSLPVGGQSTSTINPELKDYKPVDLRPQLHWATLSTGEKEAYMKQSELWSPAWALGYVTRNIKTVEEAKAMQLEKAQELAFTSNYKSERIGNTIFRNPFRNFGYKTTTFLSSPVGETTMIMATAPFYGKAIEWASRSGSMLLTGTKAYQYPIARMISGGIGASAGISFGMVEYEMRTNPNITSTEKTSLLSRQVIASQLFYYGMKGTGIVRGETIRIGEGENQVIWRGVSAFERPLIGAKGFRPNIGYPKNIFNEATGSWMPSSPFEVRVYQKYVLSKTTPEDIGMFKEAYPSREESYNFPERLQPDINEFRDVESVKLLTKKSQIKLMDYFRGQKDYELYGSGTTGKALPREKHDIDVTFFKSDAKIKAEEIMALKLRTTTGQRLYLSEKNQITIGEGKKAVKLLDVHGFGELEGATPETIFGLRSLQPMTQKGLKIMTLSQTATQKFGGTFTAQFEKGKISISPEPSSSPKYEKTLKHVPDTYYLHRFMGEKTGNLKILERMEKFKELAIKKYGKDIFANYEGKKLLGFDASGSKSSGFSGSKMPFKLTLFSKSKSKSPTYSKSVIRSLSFSPSRSISPSISVSRSLSPSPSRSPSPSPSISRSLSPSPSRSRSPSLSPSYSLSPSMSRSRSSSRISKLFSLSGSREKGIGNAFKLPAPKKKGKRKGLPTSDLFDIESTFTRYGKVSFPSGEKIEKAFSKEVAERGVFAQFPTYQQLKRGKL